LALLIVRAKRASPGRLLKKTYYSVGFLASGFETGDREQIFRSRSGMPFALQSYEA
jgi:hypothetical protein